jgi:hypothetical protein
VLLLAIDCKQQVSDEAAKQLNHERPISSAQVEFQITKWRADFFAKLDGVPLTKTEKEYFSRAVKKKVVALANAELHRMAQQLLEY